MAQPTSFRFNWETSGPHYYDRVELLTEDGLTLTSPVQTGILSFTTPSGREVGTKVSYPAQMANSLRIAVAAGSVMVPGVAIGDLVPNLQRGATYIITMQDDAENEHAVSFYVEKERMLSATDILRQGASNFTASQLMDLGKAGVVAGMQKLQELQSEENKEYVVAKAKEAMAHPQVQAVKNQVLGAIEKATNRENVDGNVDGAKKLLTEMEAMALLHPVTKKEMSGYVDMGASLLRTRTGQAARNFALDAARDTNSYEAKVVQQVVAGALERKDLPLAEQKMFLATSAAKVGGAFTWNVVSRGVSQCMGRTKWYLGRLFEGVPLLGRAFPRIPRD